MPNDVKLEKRVEAFLSSRAAYHRELAERWSRLYESLFRVARAGRGLVIGAAVGALGTYLYLHSGLSPVGDDSRMYATYDPLFAVGTAIFAAVIGPPSRRSTARREERSMSSP